MGKTERFYKIEMLIRNRGCVGFDALLKELEVSPATLKRDLQYLRDRLNAPIEYDRLENGYRLVESTQGDRHELPGLWFSENELYSLLTAHRLLDGLDAEGLLRRQLQPMLERIHQLLGSGASEPKELMRRVKIVGSARRPVANRFFESMGTALTKRRRVAMLYLTRGRETRSRREVSPQRLVHYRSTWYLDAWCHQSEGLRRFALDAVEEAAVLETSAIELPLELIEAELDAGYGIFGGGAVQWAALHFTAAAARWVSHEEWHPEQRVAWLADGSFRLEVPYTDATELAMDVLRHGDQVKVLPGSGPLLVIVEAQLRRGAAQYTPTGMVTGTAEEPDPI